jgi:hypothetical protein
VSTYVTSTGTSPGTFQVVAVGASSITLRVGSWTVEHDGVGLRPATEAEAEVARLVQPILDRLHQPGRRVSPVGHLPTVDPRYNRR